MIVCNRCQSARFLRIAHSQIEIVDGDVKRIDETYRCTHCGGEGRYWFLFDDECVTGDVTLTDDEPRMVQ